MDLKLIRIPIGNSEEDRETFMDNLKEIYPNNDSEKMGAVWDNYIIRGILQILLDVETSVIIATMSADARTAVTYWQLSGDFLNQIPHVDGFLEDPTVIYNVENGKVNPKFKKPETNFKLDNILDEIAENVYDDLSTAKKDFLNKYSNKQ